MQCKCRTWFSFVCFVSKRLVSGIKGGGGGVSVRYKKDSRLGPATTTNKNIVNASPYPRNKIDRTEVFACSFFDLLVMLHVFLKLVKKRGKHTDGRSIFGGFKYTHTRDCAGSKPRNQRRGSRMQRLVGAFALYGPQVKNLFCPTPVQSLAFGVVQPG